ncbi:MAG: hypothetical protein U9R38_00185 [Candidatus Margulisiibacteriota bacterium]|nr:hypothetical protein [Candidatus Margulisiibacteriota bacterium]
MKPEFKRIKEELLKALDKSTADSQLKLAMRGNCLGMGCIKSAQEIVNLFYSQFHLQGTNPKIKKEILPEIAVYLHEIMIDDIWNLYNTGFPQKETYELSRVIEVVTENMLLIFTQAFRNPEMMHKVHDLLLLYNPYKLKPGSTEEMEKFFINRLYIHYLSAHKGKTPNFILEHITGTDTSQEYKYKLKEFVKKNLKTASIYLLLDAFSAKEDDHAPRDISDLIIERKKFKLDEKWIITSLILISLILGLGLILIIF